MSADEFSKYLIALAAFMDSIKNILFAGAFFFAGLYVTVTPTVPPQYGGQWIGAAMAVASLYLGHRIEQGKPPAAVAAPVA